ncbi:MAG TPA: dihydropteroate synthase [Gammaproteobacteria bacterium]|nr:dihydropteroate synthase [Gammaproteobacteria bacterium]
MLILCLGSNTGDRLAHLRSALKFIKNIPEISVKQISPVYLSDALLPENASLDWNKPFLNAALRCETSLSPQELLHSVKHIEKKMGRLDTTHWGPRVIDIDLLAWDEQIISEENLQIPHKELTHRPFALWPLIDVAPFWIHPVLHKPAAEIAAEWGSPFSGEAPFHTQQIAQRIENSQLVGIINVTPDSFSDGGKYFDVDSAVKQAKQLMLDGAEIIDMGAEATNPRATSIAPEEEWLRLLPVLEAIISASSQMIIPPKISVDTRHAFVAEKALNLGIHWLNDVSGGDDPKMRKLMTQNMCDVVIMHHLGIPVDRNKILSLEKNPVDFLMEWAQKKLNDLVNEGVALNRIILDVGIGFGKNAAQCLELIKHINLFKKLGVRLLVGHSRKIFLGQFTAKEFSERDLETTVLSIFLSSQQVEYLRVHNVDMQARAFKVAGAIQRKAVFACNTRPECTLDQTTLK